MSHPLCLDRCDCTGIKCAGSLSWYDCRDEGTQRLRTPLCRRGIVHRTSALVSLRAYLRQPPALPHPATQRSELLTHHHEATRLNGSHLRIMMASGPFTPSSDLSFTPWHAFMSHVEQARPDVLILVRIWHQAAPVSALRSSAQLTC